MLIGIVSDTHGHEDYTREAIRMLESLEVERVIHCGDIGATNIPALFAAWPTEWVFGNVDTRKQPLREAIAQVDNHRCHERFGSVEWAGRKIAFLHGDDNRQLAAAIASGEYDLVCSGHTHQRLIRHVGETTALNPGALYRATPHTFAVVDLADMDPTIISVGSQSF